MRTAAALTLLGLLASASAAMAEPCVAANGARPAIDAMPLHATDPNAPVMTCEVVTIPGRVATATTPAGAPMKVWNFTVKAR